MTMPTIRLDVAIQWVIIAVLSVGIMFYRNEVLTLRTELCSIRDSLTNSAIVKLPENYGPVKE